VNAAFPGGRDGTSGITGSDGNSFLVIEGVKDGQWENKIYEFRCDDGCFWKTLEVQMRKPRAYAVSVWYPRNLSPCIP
jgi:hypothetical protein